MKTTKKLTSTTSTTQILSSLPTKTSSSSRPDLITLLSSIGDAISSFVCDAFWFGEFADVCTDSPEEDAYFAGLSYAGLLAGSIGALLIFYGPTYFHTLTHINNQHSNHSRRKDTQDVSLSIFQKTAAVCDFISHTGDGAGTVLLCFKTIKENPSQQFKMLEQLIAIVYGICTALASTRSCVNNVRIYNQNKQAQAEVTSYEHLEEGLLTPPDQKALRPTR